MFLGYSTDSTGGFAAYLEPHLPKQVIDRFADACAKKARIWALGVPSIIACDKLVYIEEAGDGPVYEVQMSTKEKQASSNNAVVFSLEALHSHEPAQRALQAPETAGLLSVYKSKHLIQAIRKSIESADFRVLDIEKDSMSIYILKWKHVTDELSSNDHLLVVNRIGDKFFPAGNFNGKVLRFVDINHDGIPEVQRSIDCDGTCEAVTSIYRNTRDLVSILNLRSSGRVLEGVPPSPSACAADATVCARKRSLTIGRRPSRDAPPVAMRIDRTSRAVSTAQLKLLS